MIVRRPSKHATEPFKGKVTIALDSSLRKRMRAARRGLFAPPEPTYEALMRHPWFRRERAQRLAAYE